MRRFLLLALVFTVHCPLLSGQNLDVSFHSPTPLRAAYITAMVKQPNGKILVAGDIAYHGTVPVNNLIRINADGTFDNSFSYGFAGDYFVYDLELLTSGDIVVLLREYYPFNFLIYPKARILKLRSDGSLEKEIAVPDYVSTIAVQSDGKVLAGGSPQILMRYNDDLTEDTAFNNAVSVNGWVRDIKVVGDKIFIAGGFDIVNGVAKNDIVKLNLNGSIDDSFDTGSGTLDGIGSLTILPDGKILPGNTYINEFNGSMRTGNVRLNSDGSVDQTFGTYQFNGPMGTPVVTDDGIYMSAFIYRNGITEDFLFRLKDDGSLDESFEPVRIDQFGAMEIKIMPVGNQLIISNSQFGGNVYGLSEVDNTGTYNEAFTPKISRIGTIRFGNKQGTKIIVAGDFVSIDGVNTFGLARLNHDGTVDNSFSLKENHGPVRQMKLFENNDVLATTYKNFFKVDELGNIKEDFNWEPGGFLYQIIKFKELDNGKLMVADPNTLARLNADGSVDADFDMGHCNNSTAFDFDMQGDNIIYGANFGELLGQETNHVARLTPQATLDETFNIGDGPRAPANSFGPFVSMVKVLDNNEILVAGYIPEFDGHSINHGLVKLSPDGAFDETFNTNQMSSPAPEVGAFAEPKVEQIGSKVYIRGIYAIYVVNIDGTVDENFSIPAVVDGLSDIVNVSSGSSGGRVSSDDGSLLAFGSFKVANSNKRLSVLKMNLGDELVSGIDDLRDNALHMNVYPRPTSGILNVNPVNENGNFSATVYDLSGKKFADFSFNDKANNEPTPLDIRHVSPGFYVLKVISASGKTGYAKFARVP